MQPSTTRNAASVRVQQRRPFRVLLVDADEQVHDIMQRCATDIGPAQIHLASARSISQAQQQLQAATPDLIILEPNLTDDLGPDAGMRFARQLKLDKPDTQTILITSRPDLERAIEAIRVGVSDLIIKPLNLNDLNHRVHEAITRQNHLTRHTRRLKKLRKLCHRLSASRNEISQQVDTLCNDLVTAYQELATQMQQVVQTQEYATLVKDELDLEVLLRKTLEHLLEKVGPTNAAIFLPSEGDEDYSLGGYINYNLGDASAEVMLQHLADTLAPRIAEHTAVALLNKPQDLQDWLGDDLMYLADCHVIATPCADGDDTLAVLVLFRENINPFDDQHAETIGSIAPLIGKTLARIIRVHHRAAPSPNDPDNLNYRDWTPDDDHNDDNDPLGV